jgi:hypothetical protein
VVSVQGERPEGAYEIENASKGIAGCDAVFPYDERSAYFGMKKWAELLIAHVAALTTERDEAEAAKERWAKLAYAGKDELLDALSERDALARVNENLQEALRAAGSLIASSHCLTRPQFKYEPWNGPCGKCAPCRARAVWYDADGSLSAIARAALDREDAVEHHQLCASQPGGDPGAEGEGTFDERGRYRGKCDCVPGGVQTPEEKP